MPKVPNFYPESPTEQNGQRWVIRERATHAAVATFDTRRKMRLALKDRNYASGKSAFATTPKETR